MIMVCGEALMDVFMAGETPTGMTLDARIGGSPFNVALGLARLGSQVDFLGAVSRGSLGDRILRALKDEGVGLDAVTQVDAPTTLGLVGLGADGAAFYSFYGHGGADRQLRVENLPPVDERIRALHFGSYSMIVEPVAAALRHLVERERPARVIAYDPNVRLNVEPDIGRWTDTVEWMASRAHLVKVSAEDLELLYPGRPRLEVVNGWLNRGVAMVVVTHASRGSEGFTARDTACVQARAVAVVDTVGAGDTFQAALLFWLARQGLLSPAALSGLDAGQIDASLTFATAAASITCSRRGADLPRFSEVAALLSTVS